MKTEVLSIILMSLWRQKIREDPSAEKFGRRECSLGTVSGVCGSGKCVSFLE